MMAEEIKNPTQAILRANAMTGLQTISGMPTTELTLLREDVTPYFGEGNIGKPAWRIEFPKASLRFPSLPLLKDSYERSFTVILDPSSGRLLYVAARSELPQDPDMRPMPSCGSATEQLSQQDEVYDGYPVDDPKVNFLGALEGMTKGGFGNPLQAKAIHAVFVLHSYMNSDPRPAWAITLRGLPPFSPRGRDIGSIPVWQRNHMRNIVDARSGKVISASNTPQPV
jgi:hypothetical protein